MDWQTISGVAALIALMPALAGLYIAWRSEQRQRRAQEKEARRWEEEARRQEKEREIEARRREREARERERKTIVHLINRLEPRQVLDAELAPPHGKYYGSPQPMVDAVKVIRDDLVYAKSELGENHKDIPSIQTMLESCNEFLIALEPLARRPDMADGGPDFYRAIDEQQSTFRDVMWGKIRELKLWNDIIQTQVIDQLGSESLEIRLSGIDSLGRTARENRDYHWPIMEVLATYVRTHALRERKKDDEYAAPKPEIQAILTIIGRRPYDHRSVEYGPIDLQSTDLRGTDLSGADLQGAILTGAILSEADLTDVDLTEADLQGVILTKANLTEANLSDVDLQGVDLTGAILREADLSKADLSGADLREARVTQEQLEETIGNENTLLPSHLKPPAQWGANTDEQTEGA